MNIEIPTPDLYELVVELHQVATPSSQHIVDESLLLLITSVNQVGGSVIGLYDAYSYRDTIRAVIDTASLPHYKEICHQYQHTDFESNLIATINHKSSTRSGIISAKDLEREFSEWRASWINSYLWALIGVYYQNLGRALAGGYNSFACELKKDLVARLGNCGILEKERTFSYA